MSLEERFAGVLEEDDPIWEDCHLTRTTVAKRPKGKRLSLREDAKRQAFNPQQRLLLLDTWRRSGLPAKDFSALVGISKHTLYKWNQLFEQQGPAGLMDEVRGSRSGSRLPDLTKRTILMLKQQHPEWGCQRISDMLLRGPALPAGASAVARVLREAGYESVQEPTRPHPDKVRRFERAKPNQLWQTDLFTFVLKRQNRRVHLVAFMDDHSRYIVSYGLHASASTALVLEVLEAGIASYGPPEEILTDNGPQYVTWRGKSQFSKRLEQRGIRQIVARPRRPQTLGKIERFWGTLWREFLEAAVFVDLADARMRIGHFIDYYNFQRVHRGLDGLVPADRFFAAATDVLRTLKARVAANALELARHGKPLRPFYVTGQVAGQTFSVHAEGERLVLTRQGQPREQIELTSAGLPAPAQPEEASVADEEGGAGPICPEGSPPSAAGEPACEPPAAPGQTRLDLERLNGSLPPLSAEGEQPLPSGEPKATEGGAS
jgi:transposase InsO family protein